MKLSKFPSEISDKCLSYKFWKKQIKYHPKIIKLFWKVVLRKQCRKLDRILFDKFDSHPFNKLYIRKICYVNIDTLYKICKKLRKKLGVKSLEYFIKLCQTNRYLFLEPSHDTVIDVSD